jgi:hypothetical protein
LNLPLHTGWAGALEASAIAFLVGLLVYSLIHALARRGTWAAGHAMGWSLVIACVVAAGIDTWHLFYLGVISMESNVYARLALAGIHDPERLGIRVVMELAGAIRGVLIAMGWWTRRESSGS